MRRRGDIWPEASPEFLGTLPEELAEALRQAYVVFARPNPAGMGYCHCCFPPEEMDRILRTPYRALTAGSLERVLQAGLSMGRWQDLAYFVPRLLECFLEGSFWADDALYHRILRSAHAHYAASTSLFGRPNEALMPKDERECLFRFFGLALPYRNAKMAAWDQPYRSMNRESLIELIGFLAALGSPLGPVLRRWRDCYSPSARLLVSLVLADLMYAEPGNYPLFKNIYAERVPPLPENEAALRELLDPGAVMEYLTSNTDHFWMLEAARELSAIETAFDLASAYQ